MHKNFLKLARQGKNEILHTGEDSGGVEPSEAGKAPENSRNVQRDPESGGLGPVSSCFGQKFSAQEFFKVSGPHFECFGGISGRVKPAPESKEEIRGPKKQPPQVL